MSKEKSSVPFGTDDFSLSLREMTIPRNDTVGIKLSTKKTGEFARFHKLF